MSFSSIKGHKLQKEILTEAVRKNRISHSYLFQGIDGIGKKLVALEFAKLLNCRNKNDGNTECSCISCSKITKGVHPDVKLFDYPGVNNIKIDDIREDIENQIFLSPYESDYKIFIIDGAERMNTNAQNAFLKTLEEPPRQSVIILVSSSVHRILPTIISRCQILNFTPLSITELRDYLTQNTDFDETSVEVAARASAGSIGKALAMDSHFLEFRKEIINTLCKLDPMQVGLLPEIVENINSKFDTDDVESLRTFFDLVTSWVRDLVLIKVGCDSAYLTFVDMDEESGKFAAKRDTGNLVGKLSSIERTWYEISRLNVNRKLALENMVMDLVS